MPYGLLFFLGAILILVFKKDLLVRRITMLAVPAISFIAVLLTPRGVNLSMSLMSFKLVILHTDKLSLFVGYIFTFIGFIGFLYSLHNDDYRIPIYAMLYIGGSLGVVFAGDFITVYLFWELMALASTALVWCNRSHKAYWTGIRYIIMHLMGGGFLLAGVVINYINTGSFLVGPINQGLAGALVLIGVGLNAAFIILHTWLPDAYPTAPFWASVFMSVYTTKTAVYMLARTSSGLLVVAWIGTIMAVVGVSFALMQNNGRRLLSYHIISQVGYMVAAIGVGGAVGINGGIFHLFNHILYKSLLFMGIGAAIYITGKEELTDLGGLSRKMPFTTIAVVVAALSISGVPLFNGFTSKKLIFEAAALKELIPIELLLELAAVGTFLSFFKFCWFGFLRPNPQIEAEAKEVPVNMRISMGIVAGLCFMVGLFPQAITWLLPFKVEGSFYTAKTLTGPVQLIAVISVAFVAFNKVFEPHKRTILEFDRLHIGIARFVPNLFKAGQLIDDAFNFVYHRIIYIPELMSAVMNPLNNALEKGFDTVFRATLALRKPFYKISDYVNEWLFVFFVDFWLFNPTLELDKENAAARFKEQRKLPSNQIMKPFKFIEKILDNLGHSISKLASYIDSLIVDRAAQEAANVLFSNEAAAPLKKFEKKVINGLTDEAATILYGNAMASSARLFDKIVVDGVINGIAKVIFVVGEKTRHIQTGLVQNYALIMVFIVSLLIFLLSIKGGLS